MNYSHHQYFRKLFWGLLAASAWVGVGASGKPTSADGKISCSAIDLFLACSAEKGALEICRYREANSAVGGIQINSTGWWRPEHSRVDASRYSFEVRGVGSKASEGRLKIDPRYMDLQVDFEVSAVEGDAARIKFPDGKISECNPKTLKIKPFILEK